MPVQEGMGGSRPFGLGTTPQTAKRIEQQAGYRITETMQDTELYKLLLGLAHPWYVTRVDFDQQNRRIDVWTEAVKGVKFPCPECSQQRSVYDHGDEQVWRHLDSCDCRTYLHARLPRVNCPEHGAKQIQAPWAGARLRFTLQFESRTIDVLKECDVTGTMRLLGTKWDQTWEVMDRAVARGLDRKEHRVPEYIGIDEKSFAKGQDYETIVCDLQRGTVEFVVDDRVEDSLQQYYDAFTEEELTTIKGIAMDMWPNYINVTMREVPGAEDKIVFDRFHATRYVTDAVDKVRRDEHKALNQQGDGSLKKTKYIWLKNKENLSENQREIFAQVRKLNLKTGRAWAIKEALRDFWEYTYPACAAKHFNWWYNWATHSRLPPMIAAAKTLKRHLHNLLTYFKHHITNACAEGINSKIQTIKQMACGYRNREHYRIAIYFHCGGLDLYPRVGELRSSGAG